MPVGARFSAPIQTGPAAYPASCTMGTGSFPGVRQLGRGADHPPSGPSWPVLGRTLPLYAKSEQIIQKSRGHLKFHVPEGQYKAMSILKTHKC